MCFMTAFCVPYGPTKWSPRPILKVREVKPVEFEKVHIKLMVLRAEVDHDWDGIDHEIWVKLFQFLINDVFVEVLFEFSGRKCPSSMYFLSQFRTSRIF